VRYLPKFWDVDLHGGASAQETQSGFEQRCHEA